jgi:hypothetical protein
MKHIELNHQGDAVKRFFLRLRGDAEASQVELNGDAVARVLPVPSRTRAHKGSAVPWTNARNKRRCDLIDKEIEGTLTPEENAELEQLQEAMLAHRRKFAPLPLEDSRRLHQELLAKAEAARK